MFRRIKNALKSKLFKYLMFLVMLGAAGTCGYLAGIHDAEINISFLLFCK